MFPVTDEELKQIKPVVCSICDKSPLKAHWDTLARIDGFI
jgi:hypothetical protein